MFHSVVNIKFEYMEIDRPEIVVSKEEEHSSLLL